MALIGLALLGLLAACDPAEDALVRCDADSVGFLPDSPLTAPCSTAVSPPTSPGGPAFSRLRLATSPDGVVWERTGLTLTRLADVPSCITTDEGLWVYFVLWEDDTGQSIDYTVVAHTADMESWSLAEIHFQGLPEDYRGLVDPAVVAVQDEATSFRLYGVAGRPGQPSAVFSFRSLGLDAWEFEAAPGLDGSLAWDAERSVFDPSVTWLEDQGNYWLFASGAQGGGQRRATSEDGLVIDLLEPRTYTTPDGVQLKPSHGLDHRHWAFEVEPGGRRGQGLWSMRWQGERWSVEEEPALVALPEEGSLGDSAVCEDPRGEGYVMIFATDL